MSYAYQNFRSEVTPRQKEVINAYKFGKKKLNNSQKYRKQKYWCETMKEWYFAMPHHFHCKLCWNDYQGDKHEIIEFNPKLHKEDDE